MPLGKHRGSRFDHGSASRPAPPPLAQVSERLARHKPAPKTQPRLPLVPMLIVGALLIGGAVWFLRRKKG